ncbi:MAG: hypothetical protein HPY79_07540 [Bacteroidales bacterium]|nr:hypothetical protein [Bacteroidales bacterium]
MKNLIYISHYISIRYIRPSLKIFFFILLLPFIFYQCNNDLDIFDRWKDNTIVYGLLNANDSIQIIRVSKSFLGEGNAYQMAQIADSIYYQKPIIVKLEEWINGNLNRTINLQKDSSIARDSGIFAYQKNYYFATNTPLNTDATYKLNILIDEKIVNAETKMIGNFSLQNVPPQISFTSTYFKFNIKTPANARLIQPVLRFFYYELTSTDTTKHYIDIKLNTFTTNTIYGDEIINIEYPSISFYEAVKNNIKSNNQVIKRIPAQSSIQIITYAGSNDLYAYMQVSAPSTSLSMDKPSFSNINNGIGLFTSRYTKYEIGKPLAGRTIDSLSMGTITKDLKFAPYSEVQLNWQLFP